MNRTTVPVVLLQRGNFDRSTLVIEACAERTIIWKRVWGGTGDGVGNDPEEPVPDGAYVMPLPGDWLDEPMEEGVVTATLLVTQAGIGVQQEHFRPFEITSGGSFPPDPGSAGCAGAPPPLPANGHGSPQTSGSP